MPQKVLIRFEVDDDDLNWPSMGFGPGRSFLIGSNNAAIPSTKTWQTLDGSPYLIEQTPVTLLNELWQTLPKPQASVTPRTNLPIAALGLEALHPGPRHVAGPKPATGARIRRYAQNKAPAGLSLDYVLINNSITNYTFASSQTYYLSGPVYLYASATFEPTVIKYTNNASLNFTASSFHLTNHAGAYAPILLLSKDDNSVGATINGSTGNPTNLYANPAINIDQSPIASMAHLRIACAKQAITVNEESPVFYDMQIVTCSNGISDAQAGISLRNVLLANVTNVLNSLAYCTIDAENCTFAGSGGSSLLFITNSYPYNLHFTNCVFANLQLVSPASGEVCDGTTNGFFDCFVLDSFGNLPIVTHSNPFQEAGAGYYYLASGCAFLGAGAPLVDGTLISGAGHKTTAAPLLYTNSTFATGTRFSPVAHRIKANAPDLGYAYDALDYLCSGISGSNLLLTNGAGMGFFGSSGIAASSSTVSFVSQGWPQAMNHLCWYPSVQEEPVKFNGVSTVGAALFSVGALSPQDISLVFTEVSWQGSQQNFFDSCTVANVPVVTMQNSQMADLNLVVSSVNQNVPTPGAAFTLLNNVFARSTIELFSGEYYGSANYNPLGIGAYNNLFWGSAVQLTEVTNSDGWIGEGQCVGQLHELFL